MSDVASERVRTIRERIDRAAERAGRKGMDIKLVGVTKTHTLAEIREIVPYIDAIGENRVQEAEEKFKEWGHSTSPQWRMIGHLQSNKIRKALEIFDSIDSLDSIDLAIKLDRIANEFKKKVSVLIEVNTAKEVSKTGILPSKFPALIEQVVKLPNLSLDGLMTIGPMTENESAVREAFANLRELAEWGREHFNLPLPILSMGMSGDFEWGILEGSTMVRIGTALFGPRYYPKKKY